jgi:hypothetical protein
MITQRTNPSMPLPLMVRHAWITASIADAMTSDLCTNGRRLAGASFSGFFLMAFDILHKDFTIKDIPSL